MPRVPLLQFRYMTDHVRIEVEHPHDPTGDVLEIKDWLSYEVESDMFTAADGFTLRVAPTGEYLRFFREAGHPITIHYGPNIIMTGIIEATPVNSGAHGPQIELTGRDLGALLMDDAAPLLDLSNQSMSALLEKLIAAHAGDIPGIITDNAANRFGLVGKHPDYSKVAAERKRIRAEVGTHKTKVQRAAEEKKIEALASTARAVARRTSLKVYAPYTAETKFKNSTKPGDTIWGVIDQIAKFVGVAAWMTADGYLCVSRPDYEQTPIGELYTRVDREGNTTDSNCLMTCSPDMGNRYSDYLCLGQGRAHATSTGRDMSEFEATARDPSRVFWWDELSRRRQKIRVMTVRNTGSKAHLTRYARTVMEVTAMKAYNMTATIEGHEVYPDGPLWAVDTMVDVEFGPKEIDAPYYIRRRQFTFDADAGKSTDLTPAPPIWLACDHGNFTDAAYFAYARAVWERYAL